MRKYIYVMMYMYDDIYAYTHIHIYPRVHNRDHQEVVHARERRPFYICESQHVEETPHKHLHGRILYERLELSEATMQKRKEMRQKISRKAKQRQTDLEDYIKAVSSTRAAPDFDADRKEFEKFVREAVESRDAFDLFVAQREAVKAGAVRKHEEEQQRELLLIKL